MISIRPSTRRKMQLAGFSCPRRSGHNPEKKIRIVYLKETTKP